ncbi:DUF6420 family protein [Streptomyces antibioticus]
MSEDRGAAGPYVAYDGLPALHGSEIKLPLIHPYTVTVEAGRYITPGGGRLTIRKAETRAAHLRITLDHLNCPLQLTAEKNTEFKRLAFASEGYCVHAGCRHHAAFSSGVLRCFEVRTDAIPLTPFVRAVLGIELGDLAPASRIVKEAEARFGPIRLGEDGAEEGQAEAG